MAEPKFTPGPWAVEVGDSSHRYVLVTDDRDLTVHYKYGSGTKAEADQDEARAHLIAASPDLLAAHKPNLIRETIVQCEAVGLHELANNWRAALAVISAAISKAEGGAS